MERFAYANPATVQEAVSLLGAQWGEADVLAGGTDLISLMKEYLATPSRVVNIKNIKELGGIHDSKAGLRIGATVTLDVGNGRVFGANNVAGDGVRDGARVGKSEIFGNDGAPAVGAKFNLGRAVVGDRLELQGHIAEKYTRRLRSSKSRIGVPTAGPCGRALRAILRFCRRPESDGVGISTKRQEFRPRRDRVRR